MKKPKNKKSDRCPTCGHHKRTTVTGRDGNEKLFADCEKLFEELRKMGMDI
jgi:hypothetical protein